MLYYGDLFWGSATVLCDDNLLRRFFTTFYYGALSQRSASVLYYVFFHGLLRSSFTRTICYKGGLLRHSVLRLCYDATLQGSVTMLCYNDLLRHSVVELIFGTCAVR